MTMNRRAALLAFALASFPSLALAGPFGFRPPGTSPFSGPNASERHAVSGGQHGRSAHILPGSKFGNIGVPHSAPGSAAWTAGALQAHMTITHAPTVAPQQQRPGQGPMAMRGPSKAVLDAALQRSGGNVLKAAARLGDAGHFHEALAALEMAESQRGRGDWRVMNLSYSLYRSAMKSAEGSAKQFQKLSPGASAQRGALLEQAHQALATAQVFAQIRETNIAIGMGVFEVARAEQVSHKLGHTFASLTAAFTAE